MRVLKLAALGAWIVTEAAALTSPDTITVVVFDYAGAPHQFLVSAAKEGRRVFRTAGIETAWILCNTLESCYVPDRFVQVKILPRAVRSTPVSANGMAATTNCPVTRDCSASYVFYDRVLAFADDTSSPPALTLAYVMAHEIGHLMGLGHRPGGVMMAGFSTHALLRAATGSLSFAEEDARELRAAAERLHMPGDPPRHIKLSASRGEVAE